MCWQAVLDGLSLPVVVLFFQSKGIKIKVAEFAVNHRLVVLQDRTSHLLHLYPKLHSVYVLGN